MTPRRPNYPVGIPLRPPPGWRPRAVPPPLPGERPVVIDDPLWRILRAALVGLMVLVCMVVGALLVQPRRSRVQEAPRAEVATAKPAREVGKAAVAKKEAERAEQPPPPPKEEAPVTPPKVKAPPARLTYERHVLPILRRECLSCHGARRRGGLDLRTRAALERGGDSGPGVRPGRPDESPLWESIAAGRMPPRKPGALSAAEKETIREWIAAGAE